MSRLSRYQFNEAQTVTGLVDENHLGKMFGNKPMLLKKTVTRLLSSEGVRNLDTLLNQFPTKTMPEEGIFTWDVTGDNEKNIPLVEVRGATTTIGSDTMYGAYGAEFQLVFGEYYFSDVHMIVGEKNELYQLRIKDEPIPEGSNFVYTVELMGNNPHGMPAGELTAGKRFSKDFSPVEDIMSTKGGDITFASPFKMANEMTTIRLEHKEPGKNLGKRVATSIVLKQGDKELVTDVWMQAVEWTMEKTWSYEKAHGIAFARSNRSDDGRYYNIGKSGYYIKQGMGLREQMEVSNTVYYNKFSLKVLESMLSDIGEGRLEYGDRTILIRTGERGAAQLHTEINNVASGWVNLTQNNPGTIRQTSSAMHPNAFVAGFQFTEYIAPMGYHIKIETDPMYDSKVRNKIRAGALGGGVLESYRYDIYFLGNANEPNIYKVDVEGGDMWGYSAGFRNPFTGEKNNMHMGTREDSATYTRYGSFGAAIVDPYRTISLIPSGLQ